MADTTESLFADRVMHKALVAAERNIDQARSDEWMRLHTCRHCGETESGTRVVAPATRLCRDWFACEGRAGKKRGRERI